MPSDVRVVPLPIFDEKEKVGAALDSPGVVARGALIAKEGDRYWLHSVEELTAVRPARHETLKDIRSRGRELKPFDFTQRRSEGLRLVKPRPGDAHAALRDVFPEIELKGPTGLSFKESALVFLRAGSAYVVVGTSYHCSEDADEHFNQTQYDNYNGECPYHTGGKLVLDTDE